MFREDREVIVKIGLNSEQIRDSRRVSWSNRQNDEKCDKTTDEFCCPWLEELPSDGNGGPVQYELPFWVEAPQYAVT